MSEPSYREDLIVLGDNLKDLMLNARFIGTRLDELASRLDSFYEMAERHPVLPDRRERIATAVLAALLGRWESLKEVLYAPEELVKTALEYSEILTKYLGEKEET
jgi:hypothetical protein